MKDLLGNPDLIDNVRMAVELIISDFERLYNDADNYLDAVELKKEDAVELKKD